MDLTREYFDSKIDRIMMRMDGLATTEALNSVLQDISGLRIEVTSFSAELADIRKSLAILAQRDREDSDAFASDIIDLKQRVEALEKVAKKLPR